MKKQHEHSSRNGASQSTIVESSGWAMGLIADTHDRAETYYWDEDEDAAVNYAALGQRLAGSRDLYRTPAYGGGLILLLEDGKYVQIAKGPDLMPVIVDRVPVTVLKGGKPKGSKIPGAHLSAMLKCEAFLRKFDDVDCITATPLYLPDFSMVQRGLNDGGPGSRILYVGEEPEISTELTAVNAFLDVMAFATKADRTNAVAAALTVLLRNHWPGGKPITLVTASKSHAGKDTVILFAAGVQRSISISYQATNWAYEKSFVAAMRTDPDVAVIVTENARLDGRNDQIASAFLERFVTDPEPLLFSTGTGPPIRVRNSFVTAISTNFGTVSEDCMNRSLPIHLNPLGDVATRESPIGNPKLEYLPAMREQIASELYGMIARWKAVGSPLDESVRHPFSVWAKTVGGILKANGFSDFLANYGIRRTADDPVRRALGILGAARPNEWLRSADWANVAADRGLVKALIPRGDQDSAAGRVRGMGAVLSAHESESMTYQDDDDVISLTLEKKRGRSGGQPHVRYRFSPREEAPGDDSSIE